MKSIGIDPLAQAFKSFFMSDGAALIEQTFGISPMRLKRPN